MTKFIATSCLVSDYQIPSPNLAVVRFMKTANVTIPFPAFLDLERGVVWIEKTNPEKADAIRGSIDRLRTRFDLLDEMSGEATRILAGMLACKEMYNLWMPNKKAKYPGIGTALMIAALSIAHQMPIATVNQTSFVEIAMYFDLPGVFDPAACRWLVPRSNADVVGTKAPTTPIG